MSTALAVPALPYLKALFRKERWLVGRFVVMSLLRAVLTAASIYLLQQFLAGVLGGAPGIAAAMASRWDAPTALWTVAGALTVCYLLISAVTYDSQIVEQRLIRVVELGVMEQLTSHLLTLSVDFFDRHSHGDLVLAMRQDVSRLRTVLTAQARMVFEFSQAVGLVAAAVWLSPKLAFLSMVALPVMVAPVLLMSRRTMKRSFTVRRGATLMYDGLLQILRGIRVIKVYQGEAAEAKRATGQARDFFLASIEMARMESFGRVLVEAIAGLSIVVVVVAGGFEVLNGNLTWPSLLAFLLAVRSIHGPVNNINSQYLESHRYGASLKRIAELLAERSSVRDRPEAIPMPSRPASMSLEHVSFTFSGRSVLDDISVQVRAGETLGIVGPSGAGKSTLLSLVSRFFDPTSGRILVDGKDLRDYALADVYRSIALVPQEPFLFAASVLENIRVGRQDASEADVIAAAQAAQIHEEILGWPDGYETKIGLAGRGVSEGQSQRLNIARALLKDAPILILDEASSSLDSIAEAKVQRALDSLVEGRITFVVAHRLSTLRHADRILVLEEGRCVGLGTHESLLEHCPLYALMWTPQLRMPQLTENAS
ncbi:MAG: ABC transporter ATP-binding protein [Phycisphaerae bacterium]|nr:ABC transporter ATP-binding protein [Gemmatimonadaceae bacterium]